MQFSKQNKIKTQWYKNGQVTLSLIFSVISFYFSISADEKALTDKEYLQ